MGVDLLKHNQKTYEKVKLAITEGKKKIAIAHATGTGKSYLIAKLFEDYSNVKKLVLVPSAYLPLFPLLPPFPRTAADRKSVV